MVCGAVDQCGSYGACSYSSSNTCDEEASESRTCFDDVCGFDGDIGCTGEGNFRTESRTCATRDTDGDSCNRRSGPSCTYTDPETGLQLPGRITYTECASGSCSASGVCGP